MPVHSQQEIKEHYQKLPDSLKDALVSVEIAEKIFSVGKKFGLTIEKIGFLAEETGFIILGLGRPEQFVSTLSTRLEVSPELAGDIAKEVNHEILYPLRETLKATHQIDVSYEEVLEKQPPIQKPAPTPPSVPTPPQPPAPITSPAIPIKPRPPEPPMPPSPPKPIWPTPVATPTPIILQKPGSRTSGVAEGDKINIPEVSLPGKPPAPIPPPPQPRPTPAPIILEKKPGSETSAIPPQRDKANAAEVLLPGKPEPPRQMISEIKPAPPKPLIPRKPEMMEGILFAGPAEPKKEEPPMPPKIPVEKKMPSSGVDPYREPIL